MPRLLKLSAAAIAAAVLVIQACEDPRPHDGDAMRGNVALADDSRAAIYLNNYDGYENPDELHGSVVIVRSDGTFDAMSTAGISAGSLLYAGDAVYGSDLVADFKISPQGTEWRERDDEQLLQESVLAMHGLPTVVFNSGIRRGDYVQDLSSWGKGGPVRGEVWGEPIGMVACGARTFALTFPWGGPGERADLFELVETEAGIETKHLRTLEGPTREIIGLYCFGQHVFALGGGPRRQRLGLVPADRATDWDVIEGHSIFGIDCGEAGRDIVMLDYERGGILMALDVDTRRTRVLTKLPGDDWLCATDRQQIMVVVDGVAEDPVLQWYDASGTLVEELTVAGLGSYMDTHDESLWGDPAIIARAPTR